MPVFSLERASKSGAIFDEEKLHWLNAIYIRNCKKEDLVELCKPFLEQAGYKTAAENPQEIYLAAIKYTKEKTSAKGKELFMPIRAALTGKVHGPELDKVFLILGND